MEETLTSAKKGTRAHIMIAARHETWQEWVAVGALWIQSKGEGRWQCIPGACEVYAENDARFNEGRDALNLRGARAFDFVHLLPTQKGDWWYCAKLYRF